MGKAGSWGGTNGRCFGLNGVCLMVGGAGGSPITGWLDSGRSGRRGGEGGRPNWPPGTGGGASGRDCVPAATAGNTRSAVTMKGLSSPAASPLLFSSVSILFSGSCNGWPPLMGANCCGCCGLGGPRGPGGGGSCCFPVNSCCCCCCCFPYANGCCFCGLSGLEDGFLPKNGIKSMKEEVSASGSASGLGGWGGSLAPAPRG